MLKKRSRGSKHHKPATSRTRRPNLRKTPGARTHWLALSISMGLLSFFLSFSFLKEYPARNPAATPPSHLTLSPSCENTPENEKLLKSWRVSSSLGGEAHLKLPTDHREQVSRFAAHASQELKRIAAAQSAEYAKRRWYKRWAKWLTQSGDTFYDDSPDLRINSSDPVLQKFLRTIAPRFREDTLKILRDNAADPLTQWAALRLYLEEIYTPSKRILVLLGSDLDPKDEKEILPALLPEIPSDLLRGPAPQHSTCWRNFLQESELPKYGFVLQDSQTGSARLVPASSGLFSLFTRLTEGKVDPLREFTASPEGTLRLMRMVALQLMVGQIQFHQTILNQTKPIPIPPSCQSVTGGFLPSQIPATPIDPEKRKQLLEKLLLSLGLTEMEADKSLSALTPESSLSERLVPFNVFESREMSHRAVNVLKANLRNAATPELPPAVMDEDEAFRRVASRLVFPKKASADLKLLVGQMLTFQKSDLSADWAGSRELPAPLIARLQGKSRTGGLEKALPEAVREQLKQNRVWIPLPPVESPFEAKKELLNRLRSTLLELLPQVEKSEKKNPVLQKALLKACQHGVDRFDEAGNTHFTTSECPASRGGPRLSDYLQRVLKLLSPFDKNPTATQILTPEFQRFYASELSVLWRSLTDGLPEENHYAGESAPAREPGPNLIPGAIITEMQWIEDQLTYSRFAALRLTYLLLQNEIKTGELVASADRSRLARDFEKVAAALGATSISQPHLASRLLSEREILHYWQVEYPRLTDQEIAESLGAHDSNGLPQYSEFLNEAFFNGEAPDYFSALAEIKQRPALRIEEARELFSRFGYFRSKEKLLRSVEQYFATEPKAHEARKHLELFRASGNPSAQDRILEEASNRSNSRGTLWETSDVQNLFFEVDQKAKTPLYEDLIYRASARRKLSIQQQLSEFCSLDPRDARQSKALFTATLNAQVELARLMGLSLPENIKRAIDRFDQTEWSNTTWGLGILAVFLAISLFLSTTTFGLATPVIFAVTMTMPSAAMISNNLDKIEDLEARSSLIETMDRFGVSNAQGTDERRDEISSAKNFLAVDAIFALMATKQITETTQIAFRAMNSSLRAQSLKLAEEVAKRETKLIGAEHAFGYRTFSFTKGWKDLGFFAQETFQHTPESIRKDATRIFSDFFKNDPETLQKFFSYYTRKTARTRRLLRVSGLGKDGSGFFGRLGTRKLSLQERITQLQAKAKNLSIESFFAQHQDEFSELVELLPVSKRQWVRYLSYDGMPLSESFGFFRLRVLARAHQTLLREAGVNLAVQKLGSDFAAPKQFTRAAFLRFTKALERLNSPERNHEVFEEFFQQLQAKRSARPELNRLFENWRPEELKRILLYPSSAQEEGMAEVLWQTVPAYDLFSAPAIQNQARALVASYRKYRNLDEYSIWLAGKNAQNLGTNLSH